MIMIQLRGMIERRYEASKKLVKGERRFVQGIASPSQVYRTLDYECICRTVD